MAKIDSTRRRKRQSKVVTSEVVEEDTVNTEGEMETVTPDEQAVGKEETAPIESTEMKGEENQDEQADAVASNEDTPSESTETNIQNELQDSGVKGKRKAHSAVDSSPSKKTKLINDGYCLFVGNLNSSKTFEEVKEALGNYLMTQSLLFQDIRLDRSKKHAFVDLASEMDLNKALTLNGEMVLDKPMKIDKAKIKTVEKVKVKATAEEKRATRDARCLFLKNVPYNATKEDILQIFPNATDVRFPGGAEGPDKGIAFVEFQNKIIAEEAQKEKQEAKIQGRVLIVDFVGEANGARITKADDDKKTTATTPNSTLFVGNLSDNVKEKNLKNVFQKAVNITILQGKGKSKRFAFVEFATVEDAKKALQSSKNLKMYKRELRVQFGEMRDKAKVLTKTLIVMGLAEKTSAETLKSAFQGALSARVIVDKVTGLSKRYGFVEFESDENCTAVKEAMEDCEIDGSKVTVAYAKSCPQDASGALTEPPAGQPADQRVGRGKRRGAGKPQKAVKEVESKD